MFDTVIVLLCERVTVIPVSLESISQSDLFCCQVITNVFFGGALSSVFHVTLTAAIVTAATLISLLIDCLGIVLELNVSTLNDLLPPFLKICPFNTNCGFLFF